MSHPTVWNALLLLPTAPSAEASNYSKLDREALGIIFGVKKLHTHRFGRRFILITDHKPLTSICSAPRKARRRWRRLAGACNGGPLVLLWPPMCMTTTSSTGRLQTTPACTQCHAYLWPRKTPTRLRHGRRDLPVESALPVAA